jgi:hypothetical protein
VVRAHDYLLRVVIIPTQEGLRELVLRDSRQASIVGDYWNAVDLFINTGDSSGVEKFIGKRIKDISGKYFPLLTDLAELKRQASFGTLRFESIYGRAA